MNKWNADIFLKGESRGSRAWFSFAAGSSKRSTQRTSSMPYTLSDERASANSRSDACQASTGRRPSHRRVGCGLTARGEAAKAVHFKALSRSVVDPSVRPGTEPNRCRRSTPSLRRGKYRATQNVGRKISTVAVTMAAAIIFQRNQCCPHLCGGWGYRARLAPPIS